MPHLDPYKALASASPFFPTEVDEMSCKKQHILMSALTFPPLNAVLRKKLSLRWFA